MGFTTVRLARLSARQPSPGATAINDWERQILKMGKAQEFVSAFGPTGTDGDASMRAILGGKGANLAEMTNLGLPVPAGFTIGTNVCTYYYEHEKTYPPKLRKLVDEAMAKIEAE